MVSILLGNGINIELGGQDYLNQAIIDRLIKNIETNVYADTIFNNKVTNDVLVDIFTGMHSELKKIIKGQYDKYFISKADNDLLSMLKTRYGLYTDIKDIGLEDFFIILRLFHLRYNDNSELIKATHDGFCWVFLDAIFNEGRIQRVASTVLPAYKHFLTDTLAVYDCIYTVNYDKTAEIIAGKSVCYLHGDFETLLDQYNSDTLIGRYYLDKGALNPVTPTTKHIYCNGLMGFSGTYKERIMKIMDNGQFGAENILKIYNAGMTVKDLKKLERLKSSPNEGDQLAFGIISTKVRYPQLAMHQYPMNQFRAVSGDLHILGISPNNDEHIWNAIINNKQLANITYFYHGDESKKLIEKLYPDERIVFLTDSDFWCA